ncbi:galactose-3-O-sulfotransferase 3-like [Amphibalanus amphitrite]|uniref:galactose-3-O-sulfotransferase 3-like n=1 Tax=Amphibalanus amphitrite TaxID=1232801 RepID=UPI001C913E09|nr:galactose-3-O-sulfotransferase 3-like [Amphibalanus amphitrite]
MSTTPKSTKTKSKNGPKVTASTTKGFVTQRRKAFAALVCVLSVSVALLTIFYAFELEENDEHMFVCHPPSAIFFLKVHKCASSSIQNMLFRLAERLDMPVALPETGNYFGHPRHFRAHMVHRPLGAHNTTYRLMAHHLRLDQEQVMKVLGPNATWLAVLRRPADQFISMFEYYRLQEVWNMTLAEFAASTTQYEPLGITHFRPNQMSFDLGLDVRTLMSDDQLLGDTLTQLHQRFDLVLIAELLDESLVLLKYRLCLEWDDVVVFRHNARPPWLRSAATHNGTLRRQLRHHLQIDTAVYHHFYQRLRQQLRDYGMAHIRAGLATLRARVQHWAAQCRGWKWNWPGDQSPLPPRGTSDAQRHVWMCSRLFTHEITYTEHIRMEQEWEAHRSHFWDKLLAKNWPVR